MNRYVENFPEMLSGIDLETLENDTQSIFALSEQLKLIYLNPGWFRFARENDGEPAITRRYPVGSYFPSAVDGCLKDFYIEQFRKILHSGIAWEHDYECSSPDLFRLYHETVYPMHNRRGILIMNSLVVETEHDPADGPVPLSESYYRNAIGLIIQCAYCRRFKREKEPDVWDWNPEWIRHPPVGIEHSLCRICFDYYFKHQSTLPRH